MRRRVVLLADDDDGNNAFSFFPAQKVPTGRNMTATATRNSTGDTSEFSAFEDVV